MASDLEIVQAAAEHTPVIHRMIHGLAVYEKLEHAMTATEDELRATLFGERPGAEVPDEDHHRRIEVVEQRHREARHRADGDDDQRADVCEKA